VKVYLACTVRGDRSALTVVRAIADRLTRNGYEVITGHLLDDNADLSESSFTEREVFERDLAWLEACDVLVAEASGSSFGVGFEVGYVLGRSSTTSQQVVLVYDRRRTLDISRLIVGSSHDRCTTLAYSTAAEAVEFITATLDRIKAGR
jgi:hypothetical protein